MKAIFAVGVVVLSTCTCKAGELTPAGLPRSAPEAQGISSGAVLAFLNAAEKKIDALHSIMIVRHGQVVAEGWWAPYNAQSPHELYSLSKSFTSTAVGLAIAEGKLSLDDPILKFFPKEAPAQPSNNLKSMRVHDLLRMSTGQQTEPPMPPSVKAFLAFPVAYKPGTHFVYNTHATYVLSAIVQKVTGQTVLDYLRPRLFAPLGIENPTWGTSSEGVSLGGYGLNIRTEDIAKFGQLYLQKGRWRGKQLVPAAWIDAATTRQTSNGSNPSSDWDQGYGYQFWRCRHGAYRGDGAFGQFCIVMPEQDAVIAITSGVRDMQAVLNLVWDKLLPSMSAGPLSPNDNSDQQLKVKLASLTLPTPKGSANVRVPNDVSGKTYTFMANDQKLETLGFEFKSSGDETTLVAKFSGKAEQRIPCGHNEWKKCRLAFGTRPEQAAAVSGAWTADNTYTAKICFYETPFAVAVKMDFSDRHLRFEPTWNVSFGGVKKGPLVGEAK